MHILSKEENKWESKLQTGNKISDCQGLRRREGEVGKALGVLGLEATQYYKGGCMSLYTCQSSLNLNTKDMRPHVSCEL